MSYPGGKGGAGVAQTLINLMPPHNVYVEPFLGSAVVLRQKRPATRNVGIERSLTTLKTTVQDLASSGWALCDRSPSDLKFPAGIVRWDGGAGEIATPDDVRLDPLAVSDDTYRRTTPKITILQGDSVEWLRANVGHLGSDALVYCDPPYVRSARRGQRDLYEFEMTDAEHLHLLTLLKQLKCMVMISGYWSQLYAGELAGWNTATFQTTVRSGATATEWVWFNYSRPVALHDYRYLGSGFRERERIKRKVKRWTGRLEKMPMLERQALLCAMGGLK